MPEQPDDFYVGYKPQASPGVRTWVRKVVIGLFCLAIVVPVLLASSQSEFSNAMFEFGTIKEFEGRLRTEPYPVLDVEESGSIVPHLLVEFGKHGGRAELGDLDDQRVRLSGQLIYRDKQRMVELTDEAPQGLGARLADAGRAERSLGRHALSGEILDSKCYLGVMKPGRGKPHRDCATRCISGGVPPMFVVTDRDGKQLHLLLTGVADQPIGSELLQLVAEPVMVEGEVVARDGLWYLRAAATDFRRISDTGGDPD